MPPKKPGDDLAIPVIEARIVFVRGHRVMLDSDLAELYGVPTLRLNEQVKRNAARFPEDFAFQLTDHEVSDLRAGAAPPGGRGGRRTRPWAFTEHGVAMLAGVLNSETAIRVNIAIIRAFVRMRQLFAVPGDLLTKLNELAATVQLHDRQIKAITDLIHQMLQPPPAEPPARRIGFVQTDHGKNSPEAKK